MITRPEESHRVWCVSMWSWSLNNEDALAHYGLLRHKGGGHYLILLSELSLRVFENKVVIIVVVYSAQKINK